MPPPGALRIERKQQGEGEVKHMQPGKVARHPLLSTPLIAARLTTLPRAGLDPRRGFMLCVGRVSPCSVRLPDAGQRTPYDTIVCLLWWAVSKAVSRQSRNGPADSRSSRLSRLFSRLVPTRLQITRPTERPRTSRIFLNSNFCKGAELSDLLQLSSAHY